MTFRLPNLSDLKNLAKKQKLSRGVSHQQSLEEAARTLGFESYEKARQAALLIEEKSALGMISEDLSYITEFDGEPTDATDGDAVIGPRPARLWPAIVSKDQAMGIVMTRLFGGDGGVPKGSLIEIATRAELSSLGICLQMAECLSHGKAKTIFADTEEIVFKGKKSWHLGDQTLPMDEVERRMLEGEDPSKFTYDDEFEASILYERYKLSPVFVQNLLVKSPGSRLGWLACEASLEFFRGEEKVGVIGSTAYLGMEDANDRKAFAERWANALGQSLVKGGSVCFLASKIRDVPGVTFGNPERIVNAGAAVGFNASAILKFEKKTDLKFEGQEIIEASILKSRKTMPGRKISLVLSADGLRLDAGKTVKMWQQEIESEA